MDPKERYKQADWEDAPDPVTQPVVKLAVGNQVFALYRGKRTVNVDGRESQIADLENVVHVTEKGTEEYQRAGLWLPTVLASIMNEINPGATIRIVELEKFRTGGGQMARGFKVQISKGRKFDTPAEGPADEDADDMFPPD